MSTLIVKSNPEVDVIFNNYADHIRPKMLNLRKLVIATAKETDGVTKLEEALKWGEPSYLTNIGSTLRMDWKQKHPDQYAMYFQCTSRLVETFRIMFKNTFDFEGNRAIVFELDDDIPTEELTYCIKAALSYHKVKNLPTLGI